jgi:CHAT domain-containing protein
MNARPRSDRLARVLLAALAAASGTLAAATEAPAAAPPPLERTIEEARALLDAGRYAEAERLGQEALRSAEAAHGDESLEAARALDFLAENRWRGYASSEPDSVEIAERAVAIKEHVLGADDPEVAVSLDHLGRLLQDNVRLEEARAVHERALGIHERRLGPGDPQTATTLHHLALLHRRSGDMEESRRLAERAVAIREQAFGTEHPAYAESLRNLSWAVGSLGDLVGAVERLESALDIQVRTLGPEHPEVAQTLNFLGIGYRMTNRPDLASQSHERAAAMWARSLGENHPAVAPALINLALVTVEEGDLETTRSLLERAIALREGRYGDHDPVFRDARHNLAALLMDLGDHDSARPIFEELMRLDEQTLGPDHPDLAYDHLALGEIHRLSGDFDAARRHIEGALALWEGTAPWAVADALLRLGQLDADRGDLDAADAHFRRALGLAESMFTPENGVTATCAAHLGNLASLRGNLVEARRWYERSLGILERLNGPDHPSVGGVLSRLAPVLWRLGEVPAAIDASIRADRILQRDSRLVASTMPERQALLFAASRLDPLDVALSAAVAGEAPAGIPRIWDAAIRSRATVLDGLAERHQGLAEGEDADLAAARRDLLRARRRLAAQIVRAAGGSGVSSEEDAIETLRREAEEAERALALRGVAGRLLAPAAGFEEVRASLDVGDALVAFERFQRHAPGVAPAGRPAAASPEAYAAFVLPAGGGPPVAVSLGTAGRIEAEILRLRQEIARASGRAPGPGSAEIRAYRAAGEALRRSVWDPVAPHLAGAERVFIVPDGALSLVSLAALPVGEEGYLMETGPLLHYLSAERDLVPSPREQRPSRGLLALGDPAFDEPRLFAALRPAETGEGSTVESAASPSAAAGLQTDASPAAFRGSRSSCGLFRDLAFEPLPASGHEATAVARIWAEGAWDTGEGAARGVGGLAAARPDRDLPAMSSSPARGGAAAGTAGGTRAALGAGGALSSSDTVSETATGAAGEVVELLGPAASEAAFKALAPGRRVLHVATHGFFLGEGCPSIEGSPGSGGALPAIVGENPLLLSGLALAGANRREAARAEEEDGVLTAEEIGALDLSGVEWAVLSGCDTGLGVLRSGEGVLGLRRAFQVAGARTLILSLSPVEDDSARAWMRRLYEARFREGLSTPEAVREASLSVLRSRRARGESTHPFYWAGFVAAGEWR